MNTMNGTKFIKIVLFAASVSISGAALAWHGGGGGHGGGWHGGGGGWHGGGWHGGGWHGGGWHGAGWNHGWHGGGWNNGWHGGYWNGNVWYGGVGLYGYPYGNYNYYNYYNCERVRYCNYNGRCWIKRVCY